MARDDVLGIDATPASGAQLIEVLVPQVQAVVADSGDIAVRNAFHAGTYFHDAADGKRL